MIIFKKLRFILGKMLLHKRAVIQYYNDPGKKEIFDLIESIKIEVDFKMSYGEAYQLYKATRAIREIKGDIAEVGTYMGGSSKIICEAEKNKKIHLFDTFEGLPDIGPKDTSSQFYKSKFSTPFSEVKKYLDVYTNVFLYKGLFPETAKHISKNIFSLVHLDVDLYKSTLDALLFFYPKMNKGGIIISHDYSCVPGVKNAFDEFFANKSESIVELQGSQCLIVKL